MAFGLVLTVLLSASVDPNYVESISVVPAGTLYVTTMEWAPDGSGRLFILGRDGTVHVWKNGTFSVFATLSPFTGGSECGLLGIAFDPDFVGNGRVYFFLTVSASEQQIHRYTDVGGTGLAPAVLVAGLATGGTNHNGGALAFGRDGTLYWGIGDNNGYVGVGGDVLSTASKIGRVNRDGTIPEDNPYVGVPTADPRIWASGFRNPYTMAVQPRTGDLWVNSVGEFFEAVFVPTRGANAGYNGYEVDQLPPYLRPVLWYKTNGTQSYPLASATRTAGQTVFTTTVSHYLHVGQNITIAGASDPTFNGSGLFVEQVISNSKFAVGQAGPDASATGGTVSTLNIGGAITGGAFLDTSNAPAGYRDDFFFADFNSGSVTRVALGANHRPARVTAFATGLGGIVDVTVGPDGALYVLRITGSVLRYAPAVAAGLVVSPLSRNMREGGQAAVSLSLGTAPSANVTLTTSRTSGDPDVVVTTGAALTFTPTNWNVPQTVVFAAAQDADTTRDDAVLTVMGGGLTPETIDVSVVDDDTPALVVGPTQRLVTEGATAVVHVSLAFMPAAPVQVTVARSSGDADLSVTAGATLTFNPGTYATAQAVTLAAAQDADKVAGAATFTVSAAGYPSVTFTATEVEDDAIAPIITTPPVITAIAGAPYTYDLNATGVPAPTFALLAAPPGLSLDAATGVLSGSVARLGTTTVRVLAQNGVPPDDVQNFQLAVAPDAPPTATLTAPQPNATVSGTVAVSGSGTDDVGVVKGELFIDGALLSTDAGATYAATWDTRTTPNGAHSVRLTVFDTSGQSGSTEARVTVANPVDPADAGVTVPLLDAGLGPVDPPRGCGCGFAGPGWLVLLLPAARRRRPLSPG